MDALAWSLPLMFASCTWAAVWLQRERDRKLNERDAVALHNLGNDYAGMEKSMGAAFQRIHTLEQQRKEHEQQIGQLTDKAFR